MSQASTRTITNIIKKGYQYVTADIDRALLILLVFSLPFERIPSFEILQASIRPSVIVGIIVILRVLYLAVSRRIKLSFNVQEKIILIFLVWLALLIPEAINITRAVSVVLFNVFTIVTAIAVSVIFDKKYIKAILYALLISATLVSAFAIYQYLGNLYGLPDSLTGIRDMYSWQVFGFPRVNATALEPLYFASYLLLPFSAATCLYINTEQKLLSHKPALVLLFLFSFIIFLTVSRSAVFGLVAALVFVAIVHLKGGLSNYKRILAVILVVLLAGGCSQMVVNYLNKPPTNPLGTFNNDEVGTDAYFTHLRDLSLADNDSRSIARQRAVLLLNENKSAYIVGIGPGQFGPYTQNNTPDEGKWMIVNNLTLEVLVESGAVGLILVLAFLIILISRGVRLAMSDKVTSEGVLAIIISMYLVSQAIQYQGFSTLYVIYIWVPIGLLLGVIKIKPRV